MIFFVFNADVLASSRFDLTGNFSVSLAVCSLTIGKEENTKRLLKYRRV